MVKHAKSERLIFLKKPYEHVIMEVSHFRSGEVAKPPDGDAPHRVNIKWERTPLGCYPYEMMSPTGISPWAPVSLDIRITSQWVTKIHLIFHIAPFFVFHPECIIPRIHENMIIRRHFHRILISVFFYTCFIYIKHHKAFHDSSCLFGCNWYGPCVRFLSYQWNWSTGKANEHSRCNLLVFAMVAA